MRVENKIPREKEPEKLRVDGVFDIETANWDQFALGGYYDPVTGFQSFTDSDAFFDSLLERGGHIWAWNGGLFDVLWFLDVATKRGYRYRASSAGTRLTRVEIGHLTIRDAVALVPFALAEAADIGGMELSKETGLPCICGTDCGGYCSITPQCAGMPQSYYESLVEYLKLDCLATWKILENLFLHAEKHSYVLKGTIGSSSWATAKQNLGLDKAEWKGGWEYYEVRKGYYGGRVSVGRVRATSGVRYDINSAYPAALSNLALPCGTRRHLKGSKLSEAYSAGKDGIFCARVLVPDCHLPPLPNRTPKGRVSFPVGRFFGSWTGLELRQAEEYGVKIERLYTGIVWSESLPIFKEFTKGIFDVRAKLGKKSGLGKWQKWFGNSLTGKLAQSPDNLRIVAYPEDEPVRCPGGDCNGSKRVCRRRGGQCCIHYCSGGCGRWQRIDRAGRIWGIPTWQLADCSNVHWAAYLTAWTRIRWLKFARQFGDSFVYGDTDSVFALHAPSDLSLVGNELGQFAFEGPFENFESLGPKAYRMWDPEKQKWICKLKGVQGLDNDAFERFKAGEQVQSERGVMGFRSAAKRSDSLFTRKLIKRSDLSDGVWFGDRRIIEGTDVTRPVTYGEQLQRERE